MSANITYIQGAEGCPAFQVDFNDFVRGGERAPSSNKIIRIVVPIFRAIRCLCISFGQASYLTLKEMPTSFRAVVLENVGFIGNLFPSSVSVFLVRTAIWVVNVVISVFVKTGTLYAEKMSPTKKQESLSAFQSEQINQQHLRTKELGLDASGVPAAITVNSLLGMLDEVNFADPLLPGYMPPSTRNESGRVFTRDELRGHLNTFVHNVTNRIPFLATPPAHDLNALMQFYQHIEDAVRLSIQKVNDDVEAFRQAHPENPRTYAGVTKQAYNELLQGRARVPLDLAIAGAHCGGRYMGEATSIHSNLFGGAGLDGSLEDEIIELLAKKRHHIAQQHIETFLGYDTHYYAKYMAALGQVLALPGTKNVVETYSPLTERQQYIDFFFGAPTEAFLRGRGRREAHARVEAYTIDTIIDTIQEHVKKSSAFRDKILDWIKDQSTGWNREKYDALKAQYRRRVQEILAAPIAADPQQMEGIRAFQAVASHVMANCADLTAIREAEGDWDNFVQQIFATEEAKQWLRPQCVGLNPLQILAKKTAIINACSPAILREHLAEFKASLLNGQPFNLAGIEANCLVDAKVKKIMDLYVVRDEDGDIDPDLSMQPPAEESLLRLVKRDRVGLEVIDDHLERARTNEFLAKMIPIFTNETITPEQVDEDGDIVVPATTRISGLSPEMMEWLLVHHKVLLPQVEGV